ncbi:HAMP domain-containing sensor histidine kinase [Mycoplasmatota bacterium WC44]
MKMNFMHNSRIRRLIYAVLIINVVLIVSTITIFAYRVNYVGVIFLTSFSLVNTVFLFVILRYVYHELYTLSDMLTKATNGNIEFSKDNFQEGILSGLQYQFAILFERLDRTSSKLTTEKEKMSELITELSHQIKTPISAIKLFNSLLQDELSKEYTSNIIYKMGMEAEKLEWFSKVLLDISKLETGLINLEPQELYFEDLVSESINSVYPKSRIKNIEIKGEIDSSLKIKLDKKWTKEALINILDNAIKYTENGGKINIFTKSSHVSDRIIISDTGRGILKEDIPHIFKRFYKGKNARTEEGTGIGLYLASEIIEMQNGAIKVSTEINKGTTFEIVFYK